MANTSLVLFCFLLSYMAVDIQAEYKDDSDYDSSEDVSLNDLFVIDSSESERDFSPPVFGSVYRGSIPGYRGLVHTNYGGSFLEKKTSSQA
ncbi:uncharacterized protein [Periplaneta americana]|uniref:uncharacterized protein isoform X2 n=1 Tax=Periplaneta americana TaxID=6978 RepID=UPI0037E8EFAB